jgi:hypothetical protein
MREMRLVKKYGQRLGERRTGWLGWVTMHAGISVLMCAVDHDIRDMLAFIMLTCIVHHHICGQVPHTLAYFMLMRILHHVVHGRYVSLSMLWYHDM